MFWDVTKRINWSAMSTKPTGMFCLRVSYHYPRGASSQLRSPCRVTFNSRPLRVKKQTPSLASSSDWHTIPVGGHKSLTAIVRPSLHSADLGNRTEKSKVENSLPSCSSLFVNRPPCLLLYLCYGMRPCQWSNSENKYFPSGILAFFTCALRGRILLITRALKW